MVASRRQTDQPLFIPHACEVEQPVGSPGLRKRRMPETAFAKAFFPVPFAPDESDSFAAQINLVKFARQK